MDQLIKDALSIKNLRNLGFAGSGCINEGEKYDSEKGKLFVKRNSKSGAKAMFEGEFASLKAIAETNTVNVPSPLAVIDRGPSGAALVMSWLDMKNLTKYQSKLGKQLADMHLANKSLLDKSSDNSTVGKPCVTPVVQFGFHNTTCCGYLPQDNSWKDDWVEFYAQNKLQQQISMLEKEHGDREALNLWSELSLKIPTFFKDVEVFPSLLHGDLWGGNAAEIDDGPVIYDPASFYGHHEFDLAIADMFGGFGNSFYDSYHSVIPKQALFSSRHNLYQLFHYLNHWNHFGGGYRGQSISIMKKLLK